MSLAPTLRLAQGERGVRLLVCDRLYENSAAVLDIGVYDGFVGGVYCAFYHSALRDRELPPKL